MFKNFFLFKGAGTQEDAASQQTKTKLDSLTFSGASLAVIVLIIEIKKL